jgi:hypothetical protein
VTLAIIPIERHPATQGAARRITPNALGDAIYSTPKGYVPVTFGGLTVAGYCTTMKAAFATICEIRAERAKEVN